MTTTTEYADLDPDGLLIDVNIRTDAKATLTPGFVSSVKALGVLVPVLCTRDPGTGEIKVRDGQRRTLAAVDTGQATIPAVIVTGPPDEARRVIEQLTANLHREMLTATDQAAAVDTLFELKVPAAQIAKTTGLDKKILTRARKVASSAAARSAVQAAPALTMEDLITLAEVEAEDPDAAAELAKSAGEDGFAYEVAGWRQEQDDKRAAAEAAKEWATKGYQIIGRDEGTPLFDLTDGDPEDTTKYLKAEDHTKCPGRAVTMTDRWMPGGTTWVPSHRCMQPGEHKMIVRAYHHDDGQGGGGKMDETQKRERRQVIDNNRAWRTATTVRQDWLARFGQRKKPPADALTFILESVLRDDFKMVDSQWHYCHEGQRALGIDPDAEHSSYAHPGGKDKVLALLEGAGKDRAIIITTAMILGAYEKDLGYGTWRSVTPERKRYMDQITAWGYKPSPVEQIVSDGRLDRHVEKDGTISYLLTDEEWKDKQVKQAERDAEMRAYMDRSRPATRPGPDGGDDSVEGIAATLALGPCQVDGQWVDRFATEDDPDTEVITQDGLSYHLAPDTDRWPRIVAGEWVDRFAAEDDPEDEVILSPSDNQPYHLAPNTAELDQAGAVTPEEQAAALDAFTQDDDGS